METPYYVINRGILLQNINSFKNALNEVWPNSRISYSVKTNSLPWLLEFLSSCEISAEVVSYEEYSLAKMCGFSGKNCVYNGPIKTREQIKEAIKENAYINLDSKNDLDVIKHLNLSGARIGIRVNVPVEIFNENDISYSQDGFRFGFSDSNEDFSSALHCVMDNCPNVRLGLHLHCNSVTRSIDVYKKISQYAVSLVKKYGLNLSFIDIGGGYFGGVENRPTPIDYISAISEVLTEVISVDKTELIVEPGSAIIGSAVDLVTSVLDVKDTQYSKIVTIDGSRINIDPLWAKKRYMYSILSSNTNIADKQIICGYTCMDHDRLMILEAEKELSIRDRIVFHRIGAYSMTFGGPFIRYFPEVYVSDNTGMKLVRKRMSTKEYYSIQST